jgi:hypothetical protein
MAMLVGLNFSMSGTTQNNPDEGGWVVRDKYGKAHELQNFFGLPQREAARRLGMSETTLKYNCRKFGIHRWPWRALTKEKKSKLVRIIFPCDLRCMYQRIYVAF